MEQSLTSRRYHFPEPSLTGEGVVAALQARVVQSRAEVAATEAVDAGRIPGVVIVPSEHVAETAMRLAVSASMNVRY
jgi:hypothetical protein